MAATATKAITVFLTGATTWAGVNLPAAWAGAVGVVTATVLAFLVPNTPVADAPKPWNPPTLGKVQGDAGQTGSALVLFIVGFLLGVLSVKAGLL